MGIFGFENRSENWKTARAFAPFFKCASAREWLVRRLYKEDCTPGSDICIELFWTGVRDYLNWGGLKRADAADFLAKSYQDSFPTLRSDVDEFNGFKPLHPHNYDGHTPYPSNKSRSDKLTDNLCNTEIDIVVQTPKYIYIGEAKHKGDQLETEGKYVLVHQLIRQYVVASVVSDVVALRNGYHKKTVVPFLVVPAGKRNNFKGMDQVQFMKCQGWLDPNNVLTWEDIEALAL